MSQQASIQLDADLRSATEQFVAFARRVRETEGGLASLAKAAGAATREIEKSGAAGAGAAKGAKDHSAAVDGLISRFTAIVSVSAAVYKAIQFVTDAHAEGVQRAQQAAEANRALLKTYQELAGGNNYGLRGTAADRNLAARLGVETKTDFQTALSATARGRQEGYGAADIRAALQFNRVTGVDPGKFFEIAGKAADAGQKIGGPELANLLLGLQAKVGARPDETLDYLDKLIGGGAQLGYSPAQVAGLSANVSQVLPGKKGVAAIDAVLQALGSSVMVKGTPTAEQIAIAQRTGVGAGQLSKSPVKLTGTALERLSQLQKLDPEKYRQLTEDAQTGIVVNQIRGGALAPLATGDLLGGAVRAADADTYRQGVDLQNQASSAAALTEAQQGDKWARVDAKRRLLIAALQQAGHGDIAAKFTGSIQAVAQALGGLDVLEGAIDDTANLYQVTLDPNRIVRGMGGRPAAGQLTSSEISRIRSQAETQGRENAGYFWSPFNPGWDRPNGTAPKPGWDWDWKVNAQRIEEQETKLRMEQLRREEAQQMQEQTEAIKQQTRVFERRGPNGSLRDHRGLETQLKLAATLPDMSARRYFG